MFVYFCHTCFTCGTGILRVSKNPKAKQIFDVRCPRKCIEQTKFTGDALFRRKFPKKRQFVSFLKFILLAYLVDFSPKSGLRMERFVTYMVFTFDSLLWTPNSRCLFKALV